MDAPTYPSTPLFRLLTESEIADFQAQARANYKPLSEISGVWHPVYQAECVLMNIEAGKSFRLPVTLRAQDNPECVQGRTDTEEAAQ